MEFTNESIGSRLIDVITSGLYDGNLNCLREYVQNSTDANASKINIYFENGQNNLVIKDDGDGMNEGGLIKALKVGISDKGEEDVGWRGIGIWSGVPSCKKLVIITKQKKNTKFRVEIDCERIRAENATNNPFTKILANATSEIEKLELGNEESFDEDHYTLIRLESIVQPQRYLFTDKIIKEYLSTTVPVPFDKTKFRFADEINRWLEDNEVKYPTARITFNNVQIFRSPTTSDIFIDKVIKKQFIVDGKLIAVGWVLTSNANKKLSPPNKGIFFKKKGFTVGDADLVHNLYSGQYNEWQYGEIHVISNELRENAARNMFERSTSVVERFYGQVGDFVNKLQQQNRYLSAKNVEPELEKAADYVESGEFTKAKKLVSTIQSKLDKDVSFPEEPSLSAIKSKVEGKKADIKSKTNSVMSVIKKEESNSKDITKRNLQEQLNNIIENLPPRVKTSVKRRTKSGREDPSISVTDPIRDLLKEKTGLNSNEISHLSKQAYGWNSITKVDSDPILTVDKKLTKRLVTRKERDIRLSRNQKFGIMIYAIHDLFVNLGKHEVGEDSFGWFEDIREEEKIKLLIEMYATIGLIYRLIEYSEKYDEL